MQTLRGWKVTVNAPAVLGFALACVAARLLGIVTGGLATRLLFMVYRSSPLDPLAWVRLAGHVLGHADWSHLLHNMMMLLLLGPMLEEKYGTKRILLMMLAVAVTTGCVSVLLFPHTALMGASGIVFAMILLAPITQREEHTIPLSFVLVAVLYIGEQVAQGIFTRDQVAQSAHIVGGLVGAALGFMMSRPGGAGRA